MPFEWAVDAPRALTEHNKIFLAALAAILAVAWPHLAHAFRGQALRVLALVGVVNYARFGFEAAFERVDPYDLLHYHTNSRFFDELGYYDLYPCVLLADLEADGPFRPSQGSSYMAQDATGHHIASIDSALERCRQVRAERFTPERWTAFRDDVLVLTRETRGFTDATWRQMLHDHGYNATPAWTWMARPLAEVVSVRHVKWLGWLDVGALAGALLLTRRAFGADAAWWTTLWLVTSYSLRWPMLTWAFLRYDYAAALLAATALLKLGRPGWAGVLGGWAAASRLFPALWFVMPLGVGLYGLARRQLSRPLIRFGVAGFGTFLAAYGLAVATWGPDVVTTHLVNMSDHNRGEQLSSRRIGLALAMVFDGQLLPKTLSLAAKQQITTDLPLRLGLAVAATLGFTWLLRRAREHEVFAYGFLPFFLATTASYYYYVGRVTLVVLHAGELHRLRNRLGLAFLFGLEAFCNFAESQWPEHRWFLIGWLAWGLVAYTVLQGVLLTLDPPGNGETWTPHHPHRSD